MLRLRPISIKSSSPGTPSFGTGSINSVQRLGCSLSHLIRWRPCEQHSDHRNRRAGDLRQYQCWICWAFGPHAALVIEENLIAWIGPAAEAPAADTKIDVGGRVIIPGFVDSHSHLIFAGDRAAEFTARMTGQPYDGGGIGVTVACDSRCQRR